MKIFIIVSMFLILVSVILICFNTPRDFYYNVVFRNASSEKIDVSDVKFGDHYAPCGHLLVGLTSGSLDHRNIPDSVVIKWEKKDKSTVERDIKIKSNLPKGFANGCTIILNINDNNDVVLSFRLKNSKFDEVDSSGNEVNYSHSAKENPDKIQNDTGDGK